MRIIPKLIEGRTYHIFNRGINSENIFKDEDDYFKFLEKYEKYCSGIIDTYAYSLLKNHFHLLVRINANCHEPKQMGQGIIKLNAPKQLSHFFNSYAQRFNFKYKRHGKLFEEPFQRKHVFNDNYFKQMIRYIHLNPQHHGFLPDFKNWEYSSYHSIIGDTDSFLSNQTVIECFGGRQLFIKAHEERLDYKEISKIIIE
jgi:REP element-mobilizing transposase RayT